MDRLRELRINEGWRQSDLAAKLNAKQQTIARYENGEREPDLDTLGRLCDIFGVTSDYLLGRSSNPQPVISDDDAELLSAFHTAPLSVRAAITTLLQPYQEEDKNEADQAI